VFGHRGLPAHIRVDNGHPWGLNKGLPPDLAPWLIGPGIAMHRIPPGQPQRDGAAGRGNGVMQQWAEPSACRTRGELRSRLEREGRIQRGRYPAIAGLSRMEAYPGLRHSGRPYRREDEGALWDEARVGRFLAAGVYDRRANARGAIWLDGRGRGLGRRHRGKEVSARFDPVEWRWVVSDHRGRELKRLEAAELVRERILSLTVGHRRPDRERSKRG
jgi:hypothetical protein